VTVAVAATGGAGDDGAPRLQAVPDPRTRKGNLESWISEVPNARGYFEASVWMGTRPNGKPDRRHVERKSLTSVKKRVRELEKERDAGVVGKPGRKPTVEEMLTRLTTVILPQRGRAPRTIKDYESKCRNDIFPRWGGQKIDRLRPDQIEDGYAEMLAAGHAPAHVRKVHAILSSAYEIEVKRGNVRRNPCALVEAPELPQAEHGALSRRQVRAVLETARARRNSARWSVGLACGLRQGEALGMRWPYLMAVCTECERSSAVADCWSDEEDGCPECGGAYVVELRAWLQLQRLTWEHGCKDAHECGGRHHKVKPCPKGCKAHKRECPPPCKADCADHARLCPERKLPAGNVPVSGGLALRPVKEKRKKTIPLPPELAAMLRDHFEAQDAERQAAGDLWEEHDLVFCEPDGRPVDPRRDWGEWGGILKAAGVPHHGVHAQRHTAATMLIDEGVAVTVVQEMLGHSDIRVTRGYVHTSSPVARDAAARMGAALFGKRKRG
jgi:integrase